MFRLSKRAEELVSSGRTDSMFFDPSVVISGTDDKGRNITVSVEGHKRFMLANKVYEDEEATEKILLWTGTTKGLEVFLNMTTIWTQERNYLVMRTDGKPVRLRTTDVAFAYEKLEGKAYGSH